MNDHFYAAFEAKHRGPRELIKERLGVYLPWVMAVLDGEQNSRAPQILDLGCGRCEWLEILEQSEIRARGVDLDEGMLNEGIARGLDCHLVDAYEALVRQPNESLSVISGFHIVEHLEFNILKNLTHEAFRVLKPGGLLIFETPNPENIAVGACQFYLDPSHHRPIPPALLDFIMEHAGFEQRIILRLQERKELNMASHRISLIDVLSGVSPDYSVIAKKPGELGSHKKLSQLFLRQHGLSLDVLANKYDELHAESLSKINFFQNDQATRNDSIEEKINFIEKSYKEYYQYFEEFREKSNSIEDSLKIHGAQLIAQMEVIVRRQEEVNSARMNELNRIETSLERLQTRQDQITQTMQVQLDQWAARLQAVYKSRSWRLTAPMRWLGHQRYLLQQHGIQSRILAALRKIKSGILTFNMAAAPQKISIEPSQAQYKQATPELHGRERRALQDIERCMGEEQ